MIKAINHKLLICGHTQNKIIEKEIKKIPRIWANINPPQYATIISTAKETESTDLKLLSRIISTNYVKDTKGIGKLLLSIPGSMTVTGA